MTNTKRIINIQLTHFNVTNKYANTIICMYDIHFYEKPPETKDFFGQNKVIIREAANHILEINYNVN